MDSGSLLVWIKKRLFDSGFVLSGISVTSGGVLHYQYRLSSVSSESLIGFLAISGHIPARRQGVNTHYSLCCISSTKSLNRTSRFRSQKPSTSYVTLPA